MLYEVKVGIIGLPYCWLELKAVCQISKLKYGINKLFSYLQDFLRNKLKSDVFKPMFLSFSAHTTTTHVQDLVMSSLDKRKKG